MTVNITINADTLELTNVDGMTRIVCNDTEKKDKPESESDWIVRRKLKPYHPMCLIEGLYFLRRSSTDQWKPYIVPSEGRTFNVLTCPEILGPITPDMFL